VLKPAGLDNSKGILTTNFLKDPIDPNWKNDAAYGEWSSINKYYPDGNKACRSSRG
jgi:branched-chain amino acid transport system substrate-binding protein